MNMNKYENYYSFIKDSLLTEKIPEFTLSQNCIIYKQDFWNKNIVRSMKYRILNRATKFERIAYEHNLLC